MNPTIGTVERAFQLAEHSSNVEQIRNRLRKEGYSGVDAHLSGASIRSELSKIIKRAV
ncbi:MAG: hypothetical protein M3Q19_02165 [Pseudomonadota bacterium]|nr:hypothetical protein [Pseudomonadota bacterium]